LKFLKEAVIKTKAEEVDGLEAKDKKLEHCQFYF
jgi:hypothetical protein